MVANLRRKRPANNPIGKRHLEMNVALDARHRLVADLWGESWSGINVNLLFGFAARAFHSHHNIAFVGHCWVTVRGILPRGAARFTEPLLTGRLFCFGLICGRRP